MWEFFGNILEKAGFVALLFFAFGVFVVFSLRLLWEQNQRLHEKLELSHETYRISLEAIQEKRIGDAQRVSDRIMEHSTRLELTARELVSKLDTMIELGKGRHGGR